jgi:hypothetical protein
MRFASHSTEGGVTHRPNRLCFCVFHGVCYAANQENCAFPVWMSHPRVDSGDTDGGGLEPTGCWKNPPTDRALRPREKALHNVVLARLFPLKPKRTDNLTHESDSPNEKPLRTAKAAGSINMRGKLMLVHPNARRLPTERHLHRRAAGNRSEL